MARFITGCTTRVPTEHLIEDYQLLAAAARDQDWSLVSSVMECLADSIELFTEAPGNMRFEPSVSSLIEPGRQSGILARDDGTDILCGNGHGVSEAMSGGAMQAHCDGCPHLYDGCDPEHMCLRLEGGIAYYGSVGSEGLADKLSARN